MSVVPSGGAAVVRPRFRSGAPPHLPRALLPRQAEVTAVNRGGAMCVVEGLRAFLPVSHFLPGQTPTEEIVGKKMAVKFLDVDKYLTLPYLTLPCLALRYLTCQVPQIGRAHV